VGRTDDVSAAVTLAPLICAKCACSVFVLSTQYFGGRPAPGGLVARAHTHTQKLINLLRDRRHWSGRTGAECTSRSKHNPSRPPSFSRRRRRLHFRTCRQLIKVVRPPKKNYSVGAGKPALGEQKTTRTVGRQRF
jgi:hypothetical protein